MEIQLDFSQTTQKQGTKKSRFLEIWGKALSTAITIFE